MSETWGPAHFGELLVTQRPMLDVRAPVEFEQGHWPGAINEPLLDDSEREIIGTIYKQQGSEAAVRRGHELVSGSVKEQRLQEWLRFLRADESAVITCFRGGLRSRTVQAWCAEAGVLRPRIEGGYKALRAFLSERLAVLSPVLELTVVTGATGSGKTVLLRSQTARRVLDLEAMANHRGSAFGAQPGGQPSVAVFENRLAANLFRLEHERPSSADPLLVEDESRMIGSCSQPEGFFVKLRESPVVLIEENLESRTEITFDDYIRRSAMTVNPEAGLALYDKYFDALKRIGPRLGGLRSAEIYRDLAVAREEYHRSGDLEPNRIWISKLLDWYYDPLYFRSLMRREPLILFRGTRREISEFLDSRFDMRRGGLPLERPE